MTQINLKIDSEIPRLLRWTGQFEKQLPFATSVALNDTAFAVRGSLNKGTISAFDKPVKFTQSAFLVQKSKKRDLVAVVYAQDKTGKDRARYLRFGIKGGSRPQKGFERYFENAVANDGTIPSGAYFMPTSFVKLTGAGNVSMATLRRITKGIDGSKRGGFFIGTPRGSDRPAGIYRRSRDRLFPYFIATTDQPDYTGRFNIEAIATKVVQRQFQINFDKAMQKALATAR